MSVSVRRCRVRNVTPTSWQPLSALLALPIFALFATGVHFESLTLALFVSPVVVAVMVALVGLRIIRQRPLLVNHSLLSLFLILILGVADPGIRLR